MDPKLTFSTDRDLIKSGCRWLIEDDAGLPVVAFATYVDAMVFLNHLRKHPDCQYPPPELGIRNYASFGEAVR